MNSIQNPALDRAQPWAPDWRPALPRPRATAAWCGCCGSRCRRRCCWRWPVSLRCRSSTRSGCCCRSCRSTSAISSFPAPRSRWKSPHLAGFSTDQRPYELWAKAAIQDLTDPDHVELKTLRAKVMMEDKSTVTLDARTGYFDSKQQTAGPAQGYLPAILHRLRGETHAGLCRHQQGHGDVGRACRRQIAERHARRPTSSGSSTAARWCGSKAMS